MLTTQYCGLQCLQACKHVGRTDNANSMAKIHTTGSTWVKPLEKQFKMLLQCHGAHCSDFLQLHSPDDESSYLGLLVSLLLVDDKVLS